MKTVTMWNIPVEIANRAVELMRGNAIEMLVNGAPLDEIRDYLWTIQNVEESIQFQLKAEEATNEASAE